MKKRLLIFLMALGRTITILLCTLWFGPLYVVGLASKPTGRQMTSSYLGEALYNGQKWAIPIAGLVDSLFEELEGKSNHCLNTYLKYKGLE